MADSQVSNFAPEFAPLVNPLVQGALGAYGRPAVDQPATADRPFIAGAIPGLTPQQMGALNWTNTLTTRPIDTTPMRNMVRQGTQPTSRVATSAFDVNAGLRAANPYDELVRKRAMMDFDEQASQASARRAAQQVGTRSLGTKTGLANAQFSRDMERQRGDLNSQLLQRGYESGRSQYNTDQARALQAAMANQQASGRDRALSLQGANQLQNLEAFERDAMRQNAGALAGMGQMVAGREQAIADYPWNQVQRLRSVLSGTGQQTSQGSSPWWQTAAGLAGTAGTLYNSGIFSGLGNLFSSGAGSAAASAAPSILDGIASAAGFARGGAVDDEDEPRGAFDFAFDDEEDEPVRDDPDVVDVEFNMLEPMDGPQGGGDDDEEPSEGGGGDDVPEEGRGFSMNAGQIPAGMGAEPPPALGALAPPAEAAPAQGALASPGLAGRLPTSGYTREQLQAALAAAAPRATGNQTSAGMDALSALLLGIGAAPTKDFGRALAAGGQNMTAVLNARKRDDALREQARQKAAALEAKTISDQLGKDRDASAKALTTEYVQSETGKREMAKLEAQEKQGTLSRENAVKLAEMRTQAQLAAANIGAGATLGAAKIRAAAEGGPTAVQRDAISMGLKPGTPEYNQFIMQHHAGSGVAVKVNKDGTVEFVQGKGVGQNGLGTKASGEVEADLLDATRDLMSLSQIGGKFDPKFMQIPEQVFMEGANMADKFGMSLSPQTANDIDRYYSFRADVAERAAQIRNKLFGAALTVGEQKSADDFIPSVKDGPKQFQSKYKRTMETAEKAVARLNYIRTKGLSMKDVALDDMPKIMNERGNALFNELKGSGMDEKKAKAEAKRRVVREFGLLDE